MERHGNLAVLAKARFKSHLGLSPLLAARRTLARRILESAEGCREGKPGKQEAGPGGGSMGIEGVVRGSGAGPRAGSNRVSSLRAPRLPQRACGGAGRGGNSRVGRELAPLARVGDGRGGVSVRAAWGRGGEAAAAVAAASELRHTGPGRREPERSAGSWWRR